MANVRSLEEWLQLALRNLYDVEKQLMQALPTLSRRATAAELRTALDEHVQETERHVERLEEMFEQLELLPGSATCEAMRHLIAEEENLVAKAVDDVSRDALMIAAVQKLEHYEIASYGTVHTWAILLGHLQVASLLDETLEEEKDTDEALTQIAESSVNLRAARRARQTRARSERRTPHRLPAAARATPK